MSFDWGKIAQIAVLGLSETASLVPEFGSADHETSANDALNAAAGVASQVLTNEGQRNQAAAAYLAAQSILKLVFAFTKKK